MKVLKKEVFIQIELSVSDVKALTEILKGYHGAHYPVFQREFLKLIQ